MTFWKEPEIIFSTVKWFQVFLSNTNSSIYCWSFVCIQVNGLKCCYLTLIILFTINNLFAYIEFRHTVKWYQVLLCITYSSIKPQLFVYKWSNSSIWPIDRTILGATTPGQSGAGSNGNEGVLCILWSSSIARTTPSDCLVSYSGYSLSLSREAVGVFCSPRWLGWTKVQSVVRV